MGASTSVELELGALRDAFERHPIPTLLVDRPSTAVVEANGAARRLLVLDRPGLAGSVGPVESVLLADLVDRPVGELAADLRIVAGGGGLPVVLAQAGTGAARRHRCRVAPIHDDDSGTRLWLVTFLPDEARAKRFRALDRQVREATDDASRQRDLRQDLADQNETLHRFARAMAHDLRAPLRHIAALAGVVAEELGPDVPEGAARALAMMETSAFRGRDLVDALLGHARATSGELEIVAVDLDEVVDEVLRARHVDLAAIEHHIAVEHPLGSIRADRTLAQVLVDNLVGNAIKYRSPERPLEIRIAGGLETVFEIVDNGVGLDAAETGTIFEPFKRLDPTVQGHGIGLATCQAICRRHGWELGADGEPGRGATFVVSRP